LQAKEVLKSSPEAAEEAAELADRHAALAAMRALDGAVVRRVEASSHTGATDAALLHRIHAAVDGRDALVDEHLVVCREIDSTRADIVETRGEVEDARRRCRDHWERIEQLSLTEQQRQTGALPDAVRRQLEDSEERCAILRRVLELLIIESGVDWAEDERLLRIMLTTES
jgi:hypothetical protein